MEWGSKIILNKINGYMPGRIAQFLTQTSRCHWNRSPAKKIFLCRHGQSEANKVRCRSGGLGCSYCSAAVSLPWRFAH